MDHSDPFVKAPTHLFGHGVTAVCYNFERYSMLYHDCRLLLVNLLSQLSLIYHTIKPKVVLLIFMPGKIVLIHAKVNNLLILFNLSHLPVWSTSADTFILSY